MDQLSHDHAYFISYFNPVGKHVICMLFIIVHNLQ